MLTREKLAQATQLVAASDADVWLTFVRETALGSDPVLPLILEGGLTWHSALMVGRGGAKVAVVGNYDADPLIASGDWDRVVPYVQGVGPDLLRELESLVAPGGKIAINYSTSNEKADGITHGMFLLLSDILRGTRFDGSLVSAEGIVGALRGQKTSAECLRMREAIAETDRMFADIAAFARVGVTERAVYDHVHRLARERGLGFSWDPVGDPIVNSGPDSMIGHGIPSDTIKIAPGHIFHIDLGLLKDDYASDIQRCWYVPEPGETSPPEDVLDALEAVNAAISAGAERLAPGVEGWTVDAAARETLVARGYPEYLHALGHQVGRAAHDGGALLGPKWDRYGNLPTTPVKEREVYTLELGITVPGRGYLGLEEMVQVTANGIEWLSHRQLEMPLLGK
jgi:Xaa-Pro aminopeptidase